ncbi:ROK family transcriptional regulator [Actinomadura sp. DC4]|uniref:ROK family transcriptional regulator n=1 Tax=Actinomadura sp. DC4 TaxID=3055069 RepID=UPI0025B05278|nr:ROK family transcriptional regulator [Actinomadura sp. DC4]MDN3358654.1 ROK family transcriptional regulator [Actinomadura sp. DC4]
MTRSGVPASAGRILQMIRSGQVSTRGELQELTGLSRSTLTLRLSQLHAAGYLRSEARRAGAMGRPSGILAFDETGKFILTADLGATHARMAVTDAAGNVGAETTRELPVDEGPRPVLGVVQKTFRGLLRKAGRDAGDVCGIGVGLPGPVDFATGRVRNPPMMPGWHGHSVRESLAEAFGAPVFVDNDANLMGLGEQRLTYPGVDGLLFVKVGTGIGSGLILQGRPERGVAGGAGDIGHIRMRGPAEEAPCPCGGSGCLAAYASGGALARRLTAEGIPARTARDVVTLVEAGRSEAIAMVGAAGRLLGEVLATAVALLNPSVLVIGGDVARTHEHLLNGVRTVLYERTVPRATRDLLVATSALGDRAGVEGARLMVLEQVFSEEAVDERLRRMAVPG